MNHGHLACAGASEGAHAYLVLEGNIEGSQRPCAVLVSFTLGTCLISSLSPTAYTYSVDLGLGKILVARELARLMASSARLDSARFNFITS